MRETTDDQVARAILRVVADVAADLIATTTHGRRELGRPPLDGVAGAVRHRVLRPVLLVHPEPEAQGG